MTRKGDDTAIGMTGPWSPADWPENELGWTMWDPALEGTGIMFEAAAAGRNHAFNALGWVTAVSYIHKDNQRSVRLAERLGAVRDDACARPHPEDLVYRHTPAPNNVAPTKASGQANTPTSSGPVGQEVQPSSSKAVGHQK